MRRERMGNDSEDELRPQASFPAGRVDRKRADKTSVMAAGNQGNGARGGDDLQN